MFVFEWDERKEKANRRKHKISFAEAKTVFEAPLLITFSGEFHSREEERLNSIGLSSASRILLVIHTEVSKDTDEILIRIIRRRKAMALEREIYVEQY